MGLWKGQIKINFPHIKVSVEKIEGSRNSFFAAYFIYLFDTTSIFLFGNIFALVNCIKVQ